MRAGKLFGELMFCVMRSSRLVSTWSKFVEARCMLSVIGTAECSSHGASVIAASFISER